MNWWWTVPLSVQRFFFRSQYKWFKPFPHLNIVVCVLFHRWSPGGRTRPISSLQWWRTWPVRTSRWARQEAAQSLQDVLLNLNLVLICHGNVVLLMSHSELKCWVTKTHETPHQSSIHQYMCVFSLRWRSWCMCILCATLKNSRISLCCPFPPSREDWRS